MNNIRCNDCGSDDVIHHVSSMRSGPPKGYKQPLGKLVSWSRRYRSYLCRACQHYWRNEMKQQMKETDTWIAGNNRKEWFIENEDTGVRLNICEGDAMTMEDDEKSRVIQYIVNTLNHSIHVKDDDFHIHAPFDDGIPRASIPEHVIKCNITNNKEAT